MYASKNLSLKSLLSAYAITLVLAAPSAFAKKDLFANDPAANQTPQTQSLVSVSSAAPVETKSEEPVPVVQAEVKPALNSDAEKKPSYLESQFTRLKGHLVEAKEDLFGSKKSSKKITPDTKPVTEQTLADNTHLNEEVQPELPTISATEAAQRAQTFAEGQVINVRKYHEEGNPRYAVKLLQKNGRMKTINLNAVNGELIEETTE